MYNENLQRGMFGISTFSTQQQLTPFRNRFVTILPQLIPDYFITEINCS